MKKKARNYLVVLVGALVALLLACVLFVDWQNTPAPLASPVTPRPPTPIFVAPPVPPAECVLAEEDLPAPPPEEAPVDVPEENTVKIRVRDLADGAPVRNLPLRVTKRADHAEPTSSSVVSGDEGIVEIPARDVEGVLPVGSEWKAPRYRNGEVLETGELWVFREMSVVVRVTAVGTVREFDPESLRVLVQAAGTGRSPWTQSWLGRHHMRQFRHLEEEQAHGEQRRIRVPRIPGLRVLASAPGWRPASAEIRLPTSPDGVAFVDLELTAESIPIRGKLLGSNGAPLAKTLVTAYVVVETTAEQIDREEIRQHGHAYGLRIWSKTGRAIIQYYVCGLTAEDGSFDLEANVKGDVTLVCHPPNEDRLIFERLGALSDAGMDLAPLAAEAGPKGDRLQFTWRGNPLAGSVVIISDLTLRPPQAAFRTTLDHSGRMPTSWLTVGHRYTFQSEPLTRMVDFLWNGEASLDIEDLWERLRDR